MKILYADTDHVSQINFVNALKNSQDWNAKYAMASPAINNALENVQFDVVICGVEFVSEVLTITNTDTKVVAIGDLEDCGEIQKLFSDGVDHFMKYPFCSKQFHNIAKSVSKEEIISDNDIIPDFDYLDRLTKGRQALKLDLMEIFISVVREELENISIAQPINDLVTIGKSAHKMKSNVRMMGLQTLMQLLDDIEEQAKQPIVPDYFYDLLNDCAEMLKKASSVIEEEVAKSKALAIK